MVFSIDFETCSEADIRLGADVYAQHPSTRVWCAVITEQKRPGEPKTVTRWHPGTPPPVFPKNAMFLAHNAGFERAILRHILAPRFGWQVTGVEQWFDTAAIAAQMNLPNKLEGLAAVLGTETQKDMAGNALMLEKCRATPNDAGGWDYPEMSPEELERLTDYCEDDTHATLQAFWKLPRQSVVERQVWITDQLINERGACLDLVRAERIGRMARKRTEYLAKEVFMVSVTELENATSTPALKAWVEARGVELPKTLKIRKTGEKVWTPSLDAASSVKLLRDPTLPEDVRQVLMARREANKASSLSKVKKVPHVVGGDGRIRGALRYCAAHTGRWGSDGLQLHNMPRDGRELEHTEFVLDCVEKESLGALELTESSVLEALSRSLRALIVAGPGKDLIGGDYAAVEARIVAWLAGQEDVLDIFRDPKQDIYVATAAQVGSKSRQFGKMLRLGFNYQMGYVRAIGAAAAINVALTPKESRKLVDDYRNANGMIRDFWRLIEDTCKAAVLERGKRFPCGAHLSVITDKRCLYIELPSGRNLRYWNPTVVEQLKEIETVEGDAIVTKEIESETLVFYKRAKNGLGMERCETYGGELTENVTQAVARDLLGEALIRIESTDIYRTVVHVHDSACAEVDENVGSTVEFAALMAENPPWASGLPTKVDPFRAKRFKG